MSTELTQCIKSVARNNGVILLYHSISESVPQALTHTLHNVTPGVFQHHLQQLSDYFSFVSLQEFARADNKRGLAAISFDDGYKNVLELALPILESFNYPFTLFLNPITFEKSWNWRDKIRYLIHYDLVDQFESEHVFNFKAGRFYRYSKNPLNNSAAIDQALDKFLSNHEINIYPNYPYLQQQELIDHPLITYGNHSQNHYVLASLSNQQQQSEIEEADKQLKSVASLNLCRSFSAPFGGTADINPDTIMILTNLGYEELLMSRQQLQANHAELQKIKVLERIMPRSNDIISEIASLFDG